ncbi:hypothetical protein WJX82_007775 [Trebouxia sp. C0006]
MSTPNSSLSDEQDDSDTDQDVRPTAGLYVAFVYARGCGELLKAGSHFEAPVIADGVKGMPLLHKAVRLILVGFKMESVPKGHSVCSMLNCDTFICRPHETAMLEQGLERCELDWAVAAGGFKVAYQLAVTQYDMLVAAYELSQEPDPENPVNAGANDTYPANMNIQECYAMALFGLGDPALAINHLGQGMYIYLQACKAKPDKNIEELMLWSADRIMELISLLQSAQGEYMWSATKRFHRMCLKQKSHVESAMQAFTAANIVGQKMLCLTKLSACEISSG